MKDVPDSWDLQDSGTFFRFEKFHLLVPLKSMKRAAIFLRLGAHMAPHSFRRKKVTKKLGLLSIFEWKVG